jgi:hypothetical protein
VAFITRSTCCNAKGRRTPRDDPDLELASMLVFPVSNSLLATDGSEGLKSLD